MPLTNKVSSSSSSSSSSLSNAALILEKNEMEDVPVKSKQKILLLSTYYWDCSISGMAVNYQTAPACKRFLQILSITEIYQCPFSEKHCKEQQTF